MSDGDFQAEACLAYLLHDYLWWVGGMLLAVFLVGFIAGAHGRD